MVPGTGAMAMTPSIIRGITPHGDIRVFHRIHGTSTRTIVIPATTAPTIPIRMEAAEPTGIHEHSVIPEPEGAIAQGLQCIVVAGLHR
jgi:hypothetical protein